MHIHFIAIGGSAMHNLAIALHKKAYKVTGSDDEIFEPSKSRLNKYGLLPQKTGWQPELISTDIDVVILGMHSRTDNPELVKAQELELKIYSYPEYLYEQTKDKKRDWRTYEQKFAERIKTAMQELSPLIEEAITSFKVYKGETRGTKPKLSLKQKVILLLLKHLFGKSNRAMSSMLIIFSLLTDVDVSYKTVERLYSDNEVIIALHNLHQLILKKKGIKEANCGGDGTGYSLTIRKHYSNEAQKLKEKAKVAKKVSDKKRRVFIYSFAFIDIETRMYVAFGSSFVSEQKAFFQAIKMAKECRIRIKKLRLDKYYSKQMYVKLLEEAFGDIEIFLIPKSNATVKGTVKWKDMLNYLILDPISYLEEYFKRNQSESGIAEDKKRTGWRIMQKREERVYTANFCTALWHNLFWYGA